MSVFYNLRGWLHRFVRSRFVAIGLCILLFLLGMGLPGLAHEIFAYNVAQTQLRPERLEQQGRDLYQTEQFAEAIEQWQQAERLFRATGNVARQAIVLSHLSLAYQQLGQWQDAEATVQEAIALLQLDSSETEGERSPILAQVLDVLGRLQLARGQAEAALMTWRRAEALYQQHESVEQERLWRNRINQAQALQSLGLYRQAAETLTAINETLAEQPDSQLKADGLRSLGNVLRVTGDLEASRQGLQQSFTVAEAIADSKAMANALFSLGYTARVQADLVAAFNYYQRIIDNPAPSELQVAAQLRQINLFLTADQNLTDLAHIDTNPLELSSRLLQLQTPIDALPLSRTKVYHRIDLANTLIKLEQTPNPPSLSPFSPPLPSHLSPAAKLLATALQEARTLADVRVESYALGVWGSLYERTQQWREAETLTQQALAIAQSINALDLSYQWQWQLGRIFVTQSGLDLATNVLPAELDEASYLQAIAAYDQAVNTLQALRSDLATIYPEAQYSFRDQVEPIYRQYVDLLLRTPEPSQENLQRARYTVEALQLAELDNFLREACLAPRQQIDQIIDEQDTNAAVIYAILLENRLEVILKLPQQSLRHYTTTVPRTLVETSLNQLLQDLKDPTVAPSILERTKRRSHEVYDWLIQPAAMDLQQANIETIVFVLDGVLRSVPMAALYDGERYLLENYNIALTSGLQLIEPHPLATQRLELLAAGISEERSNYPALEFVEVELNQIQTELPSKVLLNQQFTSQALQTQLITQPFSIVHLATHGKFSSNPDETIILAWDRELPANQLDTFLQTRDQSQVKALELLVLSACETAQGDNRAVLGLSGIAVRAGARSAIASLWLADDEATALLMQEFYAALTDQSLSRAAALRQAQLKLLQGEHPQPRYWALFILVGSWL